MSEYIHVTDETFDQLLEHEFAVLVIGKTDCWHCRRYDEGIQDLVQEGAYDHVAFGKLTLDEPGSTQVKRDNPWIGGLQELPYTVLYWKGDPVDKFAASKARFLEKRLEEAFPQATA